MYKEMWYYETKKIYYNKFPSKLEGLGVVESGPITHLLYLLQSISSGNAIKPHFPQKEMV